MKGTFKLDMNFIIVLIFFQSLLKTTNILLKSQKKKTYGKHTATELNAIDN